jgi:hypothetical protein
MVDYTRREVDEESRPRHHHHRRVAHHHHGGSETVEKVFGSTLRCGIIANPDSTPKLRLTVRGAPGSANTVSDSIFLKHIVCFEFLTLSGIRYLF